MSLTKCKSANPRTANPGISVRERAAFRKGARRDYFGISGNVCDAPRGCASATGVVISDVGPAIGTPAGATITSASLFGANDATRPGFMVLRVKGPSRFHAAFCRGTCRGRHACATCKSSFRGSSRALFLPLPVSEK